MATGKVKWFSDSKGFGFIQSDEQGEARDIFVHFTEIARDGYKTLLPGQLVEFELIDSPKGLQAKNVIPTS